MHSHPWPGHSSLQDVRLGTASLSQLDFENCGNLREVQLSGDVGGGSGSGWAAAQAAACEDENGGKPRRKVRACVLPMVVA